MVSVSAGRLTYLNDVPEDGETVFLIQGSEVKLDRDKFLIWPAEWTCAHSGGLVPEDREYFITGWVHFSDNGGEYAA